MPDRPTVSRRQATMFIAGTFAASAGSATAARARVRQAAETIDSDDVLSRDDRHRAIGTLLQNVRRAHGVGRAKAFDRCKAALREHDSAEAFEAGAVHPRSSALYRYADPSASLSRVIVRELSALPMTDSVWLERFNDLEANFKAHVAEQSANGSAASRRT